MLSAKAPPQIAILAPPAAGFTLMFFPRWRALGAGLLLALPVGAMAQNALCFATFKM
jgi:hypothetical protein